jgi:hypothetical protein
VRFALACRTVPLILYTRLRAACPAAESFLDLLFDETHTDNQFFGRA